MFTRLWNWRWLSVFVLAAVGFLVYAPSLNIGFWYDDYRLIDVAGRTSLGEYFRIYFDPRLPVYPFYRPMKGLEWLLCFIVFRGDASGYHWVQVALHVAATLFLFDSINQIARNWRLAVVAALIYLTLPAYSLAVFWAGVSDPLVGFFALLTIRLWIGYLQHPSLLRSLSALLAFVGALMSKENAIVLPLVLFLIDRWLVYQPASLLQLFKRYLAIGIATGLYALIELANVINLVFTPHPEADMRRDIGYVLLKHMSTLAFPWGMPAPFDQLWLALVFCGVLVALFKKAWHLVFLFIVTLLALLPTLQLPVGIAMENRYLYLPFMGSAIGVALLVDFVFKGIKPPIIHRGFSFVAPLVLALVITSGNMTIAESAVNFDGVVRSVRLQFRSIFQENPGFPAGTLLYLVNPPMDSELVSGLAYLRYGAQVELIGSDYPKAVDLQNHKFVFAFYQDEAKQWRKQAWDTQAIARTNPALPTRFGSSIALDGVLISANRVTRGESLVLVLYWRGLQKMNVDYTVFVQIVDRSGTIVAGYDAPPRQGSTPTGSWRVDQRIADAIVVPIDMEITPGDYTIHVGLYDLSTMQRLSVVDSQGAPVADHIVIQPLTIQ